MSRSEKTTNIALIIVCSVVCCAGLAWYFLYAPLFFHDELVGFYINVV
jgi:hypothetical protein